MKDFFKEHYIIILVMFLFLGIFLLQFKKFVYDETLAYEKGIIKCQEYEKVPVTEKNEQQTKYCQEIKEEGANTTDFYTTLNEMFTVYSSKLFKPYNAFLALVLPTLYGLCKLKKERMKSNEENINNYRRNIFKKAYRYIWLLPVMLYLVLFVCGIHANGIDNEIASGFWQNNKILANPIMYCLSYLMQIVFHSFLLIHIALISFRKTQKLLPSFLLAAVIYGILWTISEIGGTLLLELIFKTDIEIAFSIGWGMFIYDTIKVYWALFISFMWMCLSGLFVYLLYKDNVKLSKTFQK